MQHKQLINDRQKQIKRNCSKMNLFEFIFSTVVLLLIMPIGDGEFSEQLQSFRVEVIVSSFNHTTHIDILC